MSDVRHVLVLPDRDAAEEVAGELADRFGVLEEPQLVRDALAGEDDAEDAQWLVVIEDARARLDPVALDAFAAEYEGGSKHPRTDGPRGRGRGRVLGTSCQVLRTIWMSRSMEMLEPTTAMPRASIVCQVRVKSSRCSSVVARQAARVSPSMPLPMPR